MSIALPELCNGIACLKCATLKGTKFCAERAQASGTTYQEFQELTPEYKEDIKRRFETIPTREVTQSQTTASTPSTTTTQVFRVEGFPGFTDHMTAPPQEVLLWSMEDKDVKQEYVVDQTSGQLFKKTPIYKNPASENQNQSQSPNDLISALSSPDDNSQDKSEQDSLLTTFPSKSNPNSSSTQPPSHVSETSPTQNLVETKVTEVIRTPDVEKLAEDTSISEVEEFTEATVTEATTDPGVANVETEVAEVIRAPGIADSAEDTTISEVEEITEAAVTEPTTNPEVTTISVVAEGASFPEVTESTEVTEIAEIEQLSSSSTHSHHTASNTETTSESTNSTDPTTPQTPKPPPPSEGSGFNHSDLDLDHSIQRENTTTTNAPIRPVTPNKQPNPSNTPANGSSGGFLSGLIGAASSVVTGVLSVKDSLIDTATSGVSAGISGIIQGASGLSMLAKAKTGKSGKKKSRPKIQTKPNQTNSNTGQSRVLSATTSTTKKTPRLATKHATSRPKQAQKTTPVSRKPVVSSNKTTYKNKAATPTKPTAKTLTERKNPTSICKH